MPSRGTDRVSSEGPAVLVSGKLWVLPSNSRASETRLHCQTFTNRLRSFPAQPWIFLCIKTTHINTKSNAFVAVEAAQHSFNNIKNINKKKRHQTELKKRHLWNVYLTWNSTEPLMWTEETKKTLVLFSRYTKCLNLFTVHSDCRAVGEQHLALEAISLSEVERLLRIWFQALVKVLMDKKMAGAGSRCRVPVWPVHTHCCVPAQRLDNLHPVWTPSLVANKACHIANLLSEDTQGISYASSSI